MKQRELSPLENLYNLYMAGKMAKLTADEHEQIKLSAQELEKFIKQHTEKQEELKR